MFLGPFWVGGGGTAHALREQAARISACSLKLFWEDAGSDGFERGAIVRSGLRFHAEDSIQGSLFLSPEHAEAGKLALRRGGHASACCGRSGSAVIVHTKCADSQGIWECQP